MGNHPNIDYDKYPKQGGFLKKKVNVCFNYEDKHLKGIIVRDDSEDPYLTIIKLDDGRYILSTECQYSPV